MRLKIIILILLYGLINIPLFGAGTYNWELNDYISFNKGKLIKTKLNEDGILTLSPEFKKLVDTDAMFIWDIKEDSKGNIYLATGNDGIVYKINKKGEIKDFFDTSSVAAFRLLIDKNDNLYVSTLSKGLIYKVSPNGKGDIFAVFDGDYIWDMKFYKGKILLATGTPGSLYELDLKTKKFNDITLVNEMHITCMDIDKKNNIYFGTSDKGAIYKLTSDRKLRVIFQTDQKEIHSLVVNKRTGKIYAGTSDKEFSLVKINQQNKLKKEYKKKSSDKNNNLFDDLKTLKKYKSPKNTVYEIKENEYVHKIIQSKDSTFLRLLLHNNVLYIGSGDNGNIYRYKNKKIEKLAQLEEQQVLSFCYLKDRRILLGTGNIGNIYKLDMNYSKKGSYISDILDAQGWAYWGKIQWDVSLPSGTDFNIQTRSGNVEDVDDTWSDWSKKYTKNNSQIKSSKARFIQFKINLESDNRNKTPKIYSIKIPYLIKNRKPEITSISIMEQENGKTTKNKKTKKTYKKFLLKDFEVQIKWMAKDEDKDELSYSIYCKLRKESKWLLLKKNLKKNSYIFDKRILPDGLYLFKIIADDLPSNSISTHLTDLIISKPYMIDSTPPEIKLSYEKVKNKTYKINGTASDKYSPIDSLSYSIDARSWKALFPKDQIFDTKKEDFQFKYEYKAGIVIIKAEDESGNSATTHIKIK